MIINYRDDKKDKPGSHELLVSIDDPVEIKNGWGNVIVQIHTYSADKHEAIKDMHFAIGEVVANLKQIIDQLEKANFLGI